MAATRSYRSPCLLAGFLLAACTATPTSIDKQLLTPPKAWLAEPADFGLRAEPFEVGIHGSASMTGFWIPHDNGEKRTVVLFHDADGNASATHPWYRMLHQAGFQVLVFDPRGYGKSKGEPTLQAMLYDVPILLRWLRARADVDPQRIAFYGTGLGSPVAMWAARMHGCQALVLEHLPSVRDLLRESQGDDGSAFAAVRLGFAELANLPEDFEPDDNAPHTRVPALFVATDGEPVRDRKALVRTFGAYAGPKQLWLLASTGRAPHGMLTHEGEYEARVTGFLASCFAGTPAIATTRAEKVDARDATTVWQITVEPPPMHASWGNLPAVEVTAVFADGSTQVAPVVLSGRSARVRMRLPSDPVCTTAVMVPNATAEADGWRRDPSPRARAALAVAPLWSRIVDLRNDLLPAEGRRQLLADLDAAEQQAAFPPDLASELADVWARLGKDLATGSDAAERARGTALLQRAVASRPAKPEQHVWHGPLATWGWPQEDAVAMAARLLAAPAK